MAEEAPRRELFVRAIPTGTTQDELSSFFSEFAPVRHATIVTDPKTHESRGFGFVSFSTPEDASAALEQAKKVQINGRRLNLDFAKPRTRKGTTDDDRRRADLDPEQNKERRRPRLIVRNCPWSLRDPKELIEVFSRFGKVTDAYIPRGENKRMSGFAFVTMRRKAHAKRAIEESKELKIHGRPVAVDFALQKDKWVSGVPGDLDLDSDSESDSDADSDSDQSVSDAEDGEINSDSSTAGSTLKVDDASILEEDDNESEGQDLEIDDSDAEISAEEEVEEAEAVKPRRRGLNDDHTIFLRNVPYDATAESLAEHFSKFGRVAYALPVMDKELNQPKGTAFVAFRRVEDADDCVARAPEVTSSSLLVADDVDSRYVYEGRILSVTRAVGREKANILTEKRANERLISLGKDPRQRDKRRLFLLNEGRIAPGSRLASVITPAEMVIRDKSYQLRRQQLQKNPTLHLSMTRLAIRNLPRAMDEKALKALGRKAVVEFAKEIAEKKRQPLSKEEVMRSVHYEDSLSVKPNKKLGVVRQAKVIQEVKGSGEAGRSRGYGFLELRNHKSALMALRWLNAHLVSREEISAGNISTEAAEEASKEERRRRLVVEFAVENAQVVKRQRERQGRARETAQKRKASEIEAKQAAESAASAAEKSKEAEEASRGNSFIGRKRKFKRAKRSN